MLGRGEKSEKRAPVGGLAGWLIARWRNREQAEPRLRLVERITLAPRQSLALVEAEGRRILIATSPEGGPAFYPIESRQRAAYRRSESRFGRASW